MKDKIWKFWLCNIKQQKYSYLSLKPHTSVVFVVRGKKKKILLVKSPNICLKSKLSCPIFLFIDIENNIFDYYMNVKFHPLLFLFLNGEIAIMFFLKNTRKCFFRIFLQQQNLSLAICDLIIEFCDTIQSTCQIDQQTR